MEFRVCCHKEAAEIAKKLEEGRNKYGQRVYKGFHFFSEWDFEAYPESYWFLFAFEEGKPIGLMLLCKDEKDQKAFAVSYADVREDKKRQGVAKGLYKALDEWLPEGGVVIGTSLTEEGELAKLGKLLENSVTRGRVFADYAQYSAWRSICPI